MNKGEKRQFSQYGFSRIGKVEVIDAFNSKIGFNISAFPGQEGCPLVMEDTIAAVYVGK